MITANARGEFGRPSLWHTDEVFNSVTVKLAVVKLIVVVALGLCATPTVTRAQQAGKVYRVAYLRFGSPGGDPFQPVFEQALRERGWRLPSICGNWNFAKAGGLMNYSVNRADTVRQVAGYVDKLLRGANPAELPVVQPTNLQTVINLKTARALALTIPQSLLLRTDEVIQ